MKKKYFLVLILLILFVTGISSFAEERGIKVTENLINRNDNPGRQVLFLIGINQYEKWIPLKEPVKDIKDIKEILTKRYHIDEVIELYDQNAKKADIIKAFKDLVTTLKPEDSLLIFYAGHGHLDKISNTGFWIPVDADNDEDTQNNWLPNAQIVGYIGQMKSRHVLLISDSCFSGDILSMNRSISPKIDNEYFSNAYARVSRQVLTSGALETVPDSSSFARQMKFALEGNKSPYVDPLMIYNEVRLGVSGTTPLFGEIKNTGHQTGGSFLLFLRKDDAKNAEEKKLYEKVVKSKKYDEYLQKYPEGTYSQEIKGKREDVFYGSVKDVPSADKYIKEYPFGKYLSDVQEKREEYYYNESIKRNNSNIYLSEYPEGKYVSIIKPVKSVFKFENREPEEIGLSVKNIKTKGIAVITNIEYNSPAENAGIKKDDIIVSLNGYSVSNGKDLKKYIQINRGNNYIFGIIRNGAYFEVKVEKDKRRLGLGVRDDNIENMLEVEKTRPGRAADIAGLERDDVLLFADGVVFPTASDLKRIVDGKKTGDRIKIKVIRSGNIREVDLTIK